MFNFEDYELGDPSHGVDVAHDRQGVLTGIYPPSGRSRSRIESPGGLDFLPFCGGLKMAKNLEESSHLVAV